jgi:hypothetical protein
LDFCQKNRVEVIFIDGSGVGGGVVDHLLHKHNPLAKIYNSADAPTVATR